VDVLAGVLAGLAVSEVSFYVTSIYLHRALSHRSVRLSPPLSAACRVLVWTFTGIRPRQWVAVHRKHHAYSDRQGDPHSPVLLGYAKVQWGNTVLYRRVSRDPVVVARYARDLPPGRLDRVLFDHAWLGLGLSVCAFVVLLGWKITVVAAVTHGVVYLAGSGAVNAVGHHWGKRPYENLATNNRWLALLVAGEGLHNNHHAAPTSGRFSFTKSEFDPAWLVIRVLAGLRWASVRHESIRPRGQLRPRVDARA
jgi:stearoyl-CoA desaturase (delta-9 desaturase)